MFFYSVKLSTVAKSLIEFFIRKILLKYTIKYLSLSMQRNLNKKKKTAMIIK